MGVAVEMRKILYVDDENPNLLLFQIAFRNQLDVLTASSAEEALDILENNKDVDVVISDMRMPKVNGLEFIQEARKKYKVPKYCLLTGFEITSEIEEAINKKIVDKYFKKPFNKEEILQSI